MRILYGTTNPAKLDSMKRIAEVLGIEIIGPKELDKPLPKVDESGRDPLENARIKAQAYYDAFGMPVVSCDSGLYFDGLDDAQQPGTHIRRVGGRELNDEEMIDHYSALARANGGQLVGRYRNAACFIADGQRCFFSMDDSLATEPFILVSDPHSRRTPGFPLDSLSVDIATGKYYHDIGELAVDKSAVEQGFRLFFEKALAEIE